MPTDLREWIDAADGAGILLRVKEEVDPYAYEAAAILEQLEQDQSAPPVLFEAPRDLTGKRSAFRLMFNLYGDPGCIATGLGVPGHGRAELLDIISERVTTDIAPRRIADAPVHERIVTGEDVDVREIPFARHVEMEGGPYLTPTVVSVSPEGRYNLSWQRCMYLDPTHVALYIEPRHLWSFAKAAEEQSKPLPIAIILGHHPLFDQTAASLIPATRDEYHAAGGLLGEPVRLVPSVTFGDSLLVPADAEGIIEAEILPKKRTIEGSFGEAMRYVGPATISHVARVRALTHRADAIVTEVFAAHADHFNACIAIEASLLRGAQEAVPSVVAVSWYPGTSTVAISLRRVSEGVPMRAAMAVMALNSGVAKQVIVVDEDVNPRDRADVLWAVSTRVVAHRDVTIIRGIEVSGLDPSLGSSLSTSGFIIDATKPLDRPFPARARVPDDSVRDFPLERYLSAHLVAEARRALGVVGVREV